MGRTPVFNGFRFEYCNAHSLNRVTSNAKFRGKFDETKSNFFILQIGHWSNQDRVSHSEFASDKFQQVAGLPYTSSAESDNSKEAILARVKDNLKDVFIIFDCVDGSDEVLKKPCFQFAHVELQQYVTGLLYENIAKTDYGKSQDVPLLTFSKQFISEDLNVLRPTQKFLILPAIDFFFQRVLSKVPQRWSVHIMFPKQNIFAHTLHLSERPSVLFAQKDFSYWSKNSNCIWLGSLDQQVDCESVDLDSASKFLLDNIECETDFDMSTKTSNAISDQMHHPTVYAVDNFDTDVLAHDSKEDHQEVEIDIDTTEKSSSCDDTVSRLKTISIDSDSDDDSYKSVQNAFKKSKCIQNTDWNLKSFLRNSLQTFP